MEYILRVAVHEDAWQRQLRELLALCRSTPVTEVMLMEQSHQLLTSPFPMEKHRRMAAIYEKMSQAFLQAGIRCSVNLVTCVGHGDNAVPDALVLPFQPFVGEDLAESRAVYCIASPAWADYTAAVCALYARAHPARLMIDDDFRSLNHTAAVGCFCPLHARLVSEVLGETVSQRALLDAVLGIGDRCQAIREAWMNVNFSAQLHAAQKIEAAVHAVSPETQVGLMNSGEPAHSLQGRDMTALLLAFAGQEPCLSRPLGGAYSDGLHLDIVGMHQGMALSMSAVTRDTFWVSEVENYPNSPYTKSAAMTRLQMQLHALAGADALSLNLYDYLATPLPLQDRWTRALCQAAPSVETIARLRRGKTLRGVGLPWQPDAALHQSIPAHRPDQLLPERPLDRILPLLGIPVQFSPGETNVLLGDSVLSYTRDELTAFLKGGLILDGLAARHLQDLGLGQLLGCTVGSGVSGPCVEQLATPDGPWAGTLLPTDWEALRRDGRFIYRLHPSPEAMELSRLLDQDKGYLSPGMVLSRNSLGGTVCVMAAPVRALGWLTPGRRALMGFLLQKMPGCADLPIVEGVNLASFYYEAPGGDGLLAIVNCGLDPETATLSPTFHLINCLDPGDPSPLALPPVSAKFYRTHTRKDTL
ncbi:MAG: hypothetical protein Q4F17_00400 [Eubacteriales bacterium]|nr:hypothetical protein [Eubacteriales bacterium]